MLICCEHDDQCGSSIIDISTPDTLERDFNNWLNGIDITTPYDPSSEESKPPTPQLPPANTANNNKSQQTAASTDGRKNRKKGTNLYGRPYCPGRPLSMEERVRIIELHSNGMKVNAISKSLCISHGCVSKIISRFRTTGVLLPACSPEQRKSRKRKNEETEENMNNSGGEYLQSYVTMSDPNGNEYLNHFQTAHHQIPTFNYSM